MSDLNELDKIFAEDEKETPTALGETPKEKTPEEKTKDEEVQKKEEHLANINKAIAEANDTLRKKRTEAKQPVEDDDIPKIDMADPSAKAWDKHIKGNVDPLRAEIDKEKEEVRTFALKQYLADKPLLAKNPDAVKRLIDTYEVLSSGKISGRTQEGVLLYLDKAFAAEFSEEINRHRASERVAEAEANAIFSDIAVSRGSTGYPSERKANPSLTEDDKAILAKWGMSPTEWAEMAKKQVK